MNGRGGKEGKEESDGREEVMLRKEKRPYGDRLLGSDGEGDGVRRDFRRL